ncbi:NB-ARC domain-containing protein [uncultured Sphaerochaeta sp.]|uniref:NB-ARC domain-containing protein n=1 Tax=uncultured Sphaerochaeta sp. TaxID=886478 RepID=UPI002A0A7B1F|nr:NB-ARC domain-containing protein [uncultured Sphaerochaeta sp.]
MANITRLTMFALITSLENDLRTLIQYFMDGINGTTINGKEIIPMGIYEKARKRFENCENNFDEYDGKSLLDYLDYQESVEILSRNANYLQTPYREIFNDKELIKRIVDITPIRNRIMHSRPLEYSDLEDLKNLCNYIFRIDKKHKSFSELWEVSSAIQKDPGVSLNYTLPEFEVVENSIQNNLPLPDFDDTGYIGRSDLVEQIVSLCKGSFPVISILGDGGIGKTALALKVAYKLVDDPSRPFDAVIWTSSKTTQLNLYELHEIDGAIRTSLEMFKSISDSLAYQADNPIKNILEYLSYFKILLVIDNLETIIDTNITNFLQQLPVGSKVLITSRIGLGRFEYPIFIQPLNIHDSVQLLRIYAKNRGLKLIYQENHATLSGYCRKMNSNPGYIKWFVAAVGAGKSPENILANPKIFLDFCMSNVYEYLSNDSRVVINTCLSSNRELNLAEIAYISKLEPEILSSSIQQLIATNMVIMNNHNGETLYGITEFARKFLLKAHPVLSSESRTYKSRINQMNSKNDCDNCIKNHYMRETIILRDEHDNAIASQLKQALKSTHLRDIDKANSIIENALVLSPGYFEVHRINAYIKSLQASSSEAEIEYKTAINLAPEQSHLYYHLGCFTQKELGNSKAALEYFRKAVELDPNAFDPNFEVARMLLFAGLYDEIIPIISKLRTTLLNSKQTMLIEYLLMQIEYRKADEHVLRGADNIQDAIMHLDNLLELNKRVPQLNRSRAMKTLLKKCSGIVNLLISYAASSNRKTEVGTVVRKWLELSGKDKAYQHAQVNRMLDNTSGFMLLDTDEELFFRTDWFLEEVPKRINTGDDFLVIIHIDGQQRRSARYIK